MPKALAQSYIKFFETDPGLGSCSEKRIFMEISKKTPELELIFFNKTHCCKVLLY